MIDWEYLSVNPAAIHLLKANPDKINRFWLFENPAIFKVNQKKIISLARQLYDETSA